MTMDNIESEEELEKFVPQNSGTTMSPLTKKGTHPTNPINQLLKTNGSPIVSDKVGSPSVVVSDTGSSGPSEPRNRDKINNLIQKEKSLESAGLSRKKYMEVIARQLNKKKWQETRDEQGNVKMVQVDDDLAQRWAVDKLAVIFGDMIERKEIEHDLGDKTLDRFRALSVSELKARAVDLLLGKPVSRLPAIDVDGGVRE